MLRILTAVLLVGWVGLVGINLAITSPNMEGTPTVYALLLGAVVLVPALAGAVIGGWRGGAHDRSQTLRLAGAGGLAVNWLNVLFLYLWELVKFPGQDLASPTVDLMDVAGVLIVTGLGGAILGAAGYGLWALLAYHRARLPL